MILCWFFIYEVIVMVVYLEVIIVWFIDIYWLGDGWEYQIEGEQNSSTQKDTWIHKEC